MFENKRGVYVKRSCQIKMMPCCTQRNHQAALHTKKLIRDTAMKKRHDRADIRIDLPRISSPFICELIIRPWLHDAIEITQQRSGISAIEHHSTELMKIEIESGN